MSVRSRMGIGIGMCAMVSLLGGNAVLGQTTPATTERLAALEQRTNELEKKSATDSEGIWKTLGFRISGAVEASYTQNFNNPSTNLNQLRIFDTQANSFVPQVAQLVFERQATADSALDRVGFRARLNFGAQSRFSRARTNYQPGTDSNEVDFQELYAEYIAPIGAGLKIQAGKINTMIGYETINSWENPNFSRSLMFGTGQAFTTTGIRFTYPIGDKGTVALGLINGWDNIEDNNRGKTFEWKVDLTPHQMFGFAVYGSYGSEQSNGNAFVGNAGTGVCVNGSTGCDPDAKRTVVGGIITIKPTMKTTVVLEPYYANEANASFARGGSAVPGGNTGRANARWNGINAYLIQDFNDQTLPHALSLRIRGEIFEDNGGARTCVGGNNFNGGTNVCAGPAAAGGFLPPGAVGGAANVFNFATGIGQVQTVWAGTFTLQYKPAPALMTRAEFRYDKSNENVFLRGTEAVSSQQTLAFSVVYLF